MFIARSIISYLIISITTACHGRDEVRRQIESGCVCGLEREAENGVRYFSFRGIPYAEQPLGELRFKEVGPATPWNGCYNATEDGPICPQYDEVYGKLVDPQRGMDEACLLVNVHVPRSSKRRLPVLVFIHGGGFQAGSGNSDLHGPEYLMTEDMVLITFNYRLNVFGFLSLGSAEVPGNCGLRDVLTLLRWVQRNVDAFGGDPDDVTIAGHSAGATLAHLITLSAPAEGLFKRVILMSGTAFEAYYTSSPEYASKISKTFLNILGIDFSDSNVHQKLINMPLETIMNANRQVQFIAGLVTFAPVVEGIYAGITRILDDNPSSLIRQGCGSDIPLIIGFTSAEGEFFRQKIKLLDMLKRIRQTPSILLNSKLANSVSNHTGALLGHKVRQRYTTKEDFTITDYLRVSTDNMFVYPAFKLAQARASMAGAPVYLYQYSYPSTHNLVKEGLMLNYEDGAAHGEDLTFLFRNNVLLGRHKSFPPINSDDLMKLWITKIVANFVRCSSPECNDESAWPPVDAEKLNYQSLFNPVFNRTHKCATAAQREMIQFFDTIEEYARSMDAA